MENLTFRMGRNGIMQVIENPTPDLDSIVVDHGPLNDPNIYPRTFAIYHILNQVMSYVDVEGLKICRIVNSDWNNVATPYLQKRAIIYFDGHFDEEEEPPENPEDPAEFYKDVRNYMKLDSPFVCESYCLSKGAKHTEQLREILAFARKFGPQIKHLRLDYEFHSHFSVDMIRRLLVEYLTNLEYLDIRNMPVCMGMMTRYMIPTEITNSNCGHWPEDDENPVFWPKAYGPFRPLVSIKKLEIRNSNEYVGKMGQNFVWDLLSVFPNLEHLKIADRYYEGIPGYALRGIEIHESWAKNLNELILESKGSPTDDDIRIISELNRTLSVLHLGTLPHLRDATHFQNLINRHSPNLKDFEFGNFGAEDMSSFKQEPTPISISLPPFPKLRKLQFTQEIPNATAFNVTFPPVDYKYHFPALMYLGNCHFGNSIYTHDDDPWRNSYGGGSRRKPNYFKGMTNLWTSLFPNDGQVCSTLRVLDIPMSKEKPSRLYFRLAKMFPEVNNEILNACRDVPKSSQTHELD